jgi:c-di-GMP-binding flagellar brake protein YcgR
VKALEPGAHVVLHLPSLGRLPARIESSGEGRLELALFVRPETPIPWLESKEAEIECVGRRGIYRVTGTVSAEGGLRDASVTLFVDGEPELTQRRDFVRVDATMPVTVRTNAGVVDTFATNVSGGGFCVAGPATLAIDDLITFALRLPDDRRVEGRARVVRDGDRGMKGCSIEEIDDAGRELLVRFTFDRQRDELKRGVSR